VAIVEVHDPQTCKLGDLSLAGKVDVMGAGIKYCVKLE
jgi:hypothetical protein